MAFQAGDRVDQQQYGTGDVIEVNADYITIAFDDGTTRKFLSRKVQLRPSDVSRPLPRGPARRATRKPGPLAAAAGRLDKGRAP